MLGATCTCTLNTCTVYAATSEVVMVTSKINSAC